MCAIALVYNDKGNSHVEVSAMLDVMAHRGNDSLAIDGYANCTVGYRRMAVTNILNGKSSLNGRYRVYLNGEIYNYRELGFDGNENEVLEQGFDYYGISFVRKLNGMFVMLVVDTKSNEVFLLRDRYGIKPFYIYKSGINWICASEIKAIATHPLFQFEVNEVVKSDWFIYNNNWSDETLFKGVSMMPKGSIINVTKGTIDYYWKWDYRTDNSIKFDDAVIRVRELVIAAIRKMIPLEVLYGTCLSSGIDSNIIYSQFPQKTPTFTAGFYNYKDDERSIVERISKNCYQVVYNHPRNFEASIRALEDLKVGASFSNYGLFEMGSKFCKVIFDGTGADELFGGYSWRYDLSRDYYSVVNRTGLGGDYDARRFQINVFPSDGLAARLKFDAEYFMPAVLMVGDKMSMAHTVEMRVPFLDNDLVDYVLTLPLEFLKDKILLKEAFKDVLPDFVLDAPKKGFSSPDYFGTGNKALNWATAAYDEWNEIFNTN
jgi:asparagine synthase (glutamine-hydrolysing)